MPNIEETIARIGPLDQEAMVAARARQDQLTKPTGALGRLEELSVRLAGITGSLRPSLERRAVIVMAGDHGIARQGVSAYPSEVTQQMVLNFLRGGAAVNVLARQMGARVTVVDMGVAGPLEPAPRLLLRKVALGTADFSAGPAMSSAQARQSIETGIEVLELELAQGLELVATGDMGIGNTTASSALVAVFTREPPELVTGHGTGVDDTAWRHKVQVITAALQRHQPDVRDPIDVLAKVGGFELGGLAGVMLGGAAHRIPVVVDGFIAAAAALVAAALAPGVRDYLIASHRSVEPGHVIALKELGLRPMLDMDMRLGEGTGALLAFPLLEAAVRLLNEMATFGEAGVSERSDPPAADA